MHKIFFLIVALSFASCELRNDKAEKYQCEVKPVRNSFTRVALIRSYPIDILQGIASIDVPTEAGAMGRNKAAYFHVRFQMGILGQSDYAVASNNEQALAYAVKSIEYSFEYQLDNGNFTLVIPPNLSGQTPTEADLASGVSFFLSSLGVALTNFAQSDWYNSPPMASYKARVEALRPKIELAANWLLTKQSILETADQHAPNRLFFNALAFYSLGKWLNNDTFTLAGLRFASLAMQTKHPQGYFLEANGWDSSYQGVAVNVGFNLYSLLPDSEPIKSDLWISISCAADWLRSRVQASGEISTEGNTRVYEGGEAFLGQEKGVDWVKGMVGLFAMGYFTADNLFVSAANSIKEFYK